MRRFAIGLSACLFIACVERGSGPVVEAASKANPSDYIIAAVPDEVRGPQANVGAVDYLGAVLEPAELVPGQVATITHYWRVREGVTGQWRVFTHLRGRDVTADFMNLDESPMRAAHPPDQWKAGQILRDSRQFVLRPDWKSDVATVWVGFYRLGGRSLAERMPVLGDSASVVDNAIRAVEAYVDRSQAPPPAGTLYVRRTPTAPTIDGLGNDPAWQTVAASGDFPVADGSGNPSGRTIGRLVWDDAGLFALVNVTDTDIRNDYKNRDESIWRQDVVEMFIDADRNGRGYIELQVSPLNVQFDKWFPKTRNEDGDVAWSSGMVSMVKVNGTVNAEGGDQGYDVELFVPWAAVKGADPTMAVTLPPAVGDKMRLNIVRVDYNTGGATWASWNRIGNDFHALDRMLNVVFADEAGKIKPPNGASPGPTPPPIGPSVTK